MSLGGRVDVLVRWRGGVVVKNGGWPSEYSCVGSPSDFQGSMERVRRVGEEGRSPRRRWWGGRRREEEEDEEEEEEGTRKREEEKEARDGLAFEGCSQGSGCCGRCPGPGS